MRLKYWLLFILQSLGGMVLLWKGVPLYRNFLTGAADPEHSSFLWSLTVIALIQPAFWKGRNYKIIEKGQGAWNTVIGHVVLFFGRMTFLFVGGVFSAVFYNRFSEFHATPYQITMLLLLLFSMFCFTLEVERVGKAFIDTSNS